MKRLASTLLVFALALGASPALAQDANVVEARALFTHGTELVANAQWAEALASFEQSAAKRPHPITTYNVAACERALGRYTLARAHFARAVTEGEAQPGALPASLESDAKSYAAQIDDILVHASVHVDPPDARIAVDGRPIEFTTTGGTTTGVAGVLAAGAGTAPPASRFDLVLDPGAHVLTLARTGFADVVVNRTFAPKARVDLKLELDRLPAVIHVASNVTGAIVTVGDSDVGPVPVDVTRPAGSYRVVVKKGGFDTYEAQISVKPGEEANLRAPLVLEKTPLTKRWWFWTIIGVAVAGAATATYFIAAGQQQPVRPPENGGGLGWIVKLP
jgi:hypothetical protein